MPDAEDELYSMISEEVSKQIDFDILKSILKDDKEFCENIKNGPIQNTLTISHEMYSELFNHRGERPLEEWTSEDLMQEAILIKTKQSKLSANKRKQVLEMIKEKTPWKKRDTK
jgi:hypothetical protein